ncbi:HepT-like ribonuclease domain-containing protein [Rhodoplanes roseus]|nr:HepT-like ribonuclease domain-containing protein [Rhodoplanes roseus]
MSPIESRSDLDRLRDAREYALDTWSNAGGLDAEILAGARQPLHAALFDLVVVGEALNKVSAEVKTAAPDIPWQAIVGLRNVIVHSYWQIDLELVADVIANRIDPLVAGLDRLITLVQRPSP